MFPQLRTSPLDLSTKFCENYTMFGEGPCPTRAQHKYCKIFTNFCWQLYSPHCPPPPWQRPRWWWQSSGICGGWEPFLSLSKITNSPLLGVLTLSWPSFSSSSCLRSKEVLLTSALHNISPRQWQRSVVWQLWKSVEVFIGDPFFSVGWGTTLFRQSLFSFHQFSILNYCKMPF